MSFALFFGQRVSNASTFIFRSLRLCVCVCGYTALVRCVLALRCGSAGVVWCGIVMKAEAALQPG